jgi:predicted RNase H-like HicB family nuclease
MRHVILTPIEDGWWMAEVPSLPGCHTQGETKEEAMSNIKEAIDSYIASLEEDGEPIPDDVNVELVTV